jgi:hypothetical protein
MSENETLKVPTRTDPEWTDHVMTFFQEHELENRNPKVGGLRRVAELLVGEIVSLRSIVNESPRQDNQYRAVVTVEVAFLQEGGRSRFFCGSADACARNVDGPYAAFPVAMAETRAKGRAFRNALALEVVCAEELSENAVPDISDERINDNQVNVIESLCKRLKLDVKKFVNSGQTQYDCIKSVSYDTAVKMTQRLSKYQQDTSSIDQSLVGYNVNWRKDFYEQSTN